MRLAPSDEQHATPLMALAYANTGSILKAGRAMSLLVMWGIAEQELGHPLGEADGGTLSAQLREYARWAKESERTAWRHLGDFRAAFPGEDSPANLAAQVRESVELKRGAKGQAAVGSLLVVA